jgi:hypothetical protein
MTAAVRLVTQKAEIFPHGICAFCPARRGLGIRRTSDGVRGARLHTLASFDRILVLKGIAMNLIQCIRRLAAVLAGLGGAALMSIIVAPAAFAVREPPPGGGGAPASPAPPDTVAVVAGGMPGWQIALIAVGAALLAAVLAVLLDRTWAARRSLAARGA